ncbi:uncharacterized protein [Clinocottus analis]|uniref:uncharacterized protein n=1 Tax=Clinocottus analis TaxID=304258 RepID=UPI0035C1DCE8
MMCNSCLTVFSSAGAQETRTGVSTEGSGVTAASWKWYALVDEALGARPSVTPPVLFASSSREVAGTPSHQPVVTPLPVVHSSGVSSTVSTPKRRRVDTVGVAELIQANDRTLSRVWKEMEERQRRSEKARRHFLEVLVLAGPLLPSRHLHLVPAPLYNICLTNGTVQHTMTSGTNWRVYWLVLCCLPDICIWFQHRCTTFASPTAQCSTQ